MLSELDSVQYAKYLREWLEEEEEAVRVMVDAGDFGRPLEINNIHAKLQRFRKMETPWSSPGSPNEYGFGAKFYCLQDETKSSKPLSLCCLARGKVKETGAPVAILLFLLTDAQQRSKGYGSTVVGLACRDFQEINGNCPVSLIVAEDNVKAQKFYERCGFKADGHTRIKRDRTFLGYTLKAQ
eukprot:TRINITY_DN20936_c0_g1_i1.p1 TRINITY_DN20936_c0_g1~~TRINITY_DN20936_c0_g1_i1.p1  ORF type:complete len:183 (-),score=25.03 TRINITY_DN20936_c0_g1_i1:9-557(-)